MKFKDKNIYSKIDTLKNQYQIFIHNQFINYYLLDSNIPKNDWLDIEDLINSNKYYEAEGYDLNKLYEQIFTFSSFLKRIKIRILPRMKSESESRMRKLSSNNKILYKMTLDNLPVNLKSFGDLIIDLFVNVKRVDKKIHGEKNMLYLRLPFIREIEKNLNI